MVSSMGWFGAPITSSLISNRLSIPHVFLFTGVFFGVAFLYSLVARQGIRRLLASGKGEAGRPARRRVSRR